MAEAPREADNDDPTPPAPPAPRGGESRLRYFCHQCSASIVPNLPDYTCPNCDSGFIEEMSSEEPEEDPAQHFMDLWERTFLNSLQEHGTGRGNRSSGSQDSNRSGEVSVNSSSGSSARMPRFIDLSPRRGHHGGHHHHHHAHFHGQFNPETAGMDFIISHILQTLTGNGGLMPMNLVHLHGNPADYAWGEQGLDSIVTQLLNQLEGTGPPPASKDEMEKLSVRTITDADVEKTLQCSVCFEEYSKGEQVRCLPCQHVYHDACIFPWLERHGSCPVCRKDLAGKDTSTDDGPAPDAPANGFMDDAEDCD